MTLMTESAPTMRSLYVAGGRTALICERVTVGSALGNELLFSPSVLNREAPHIARRPLEEV